MHDNYCMRYKKVASSLPGKSKGTVYIRIPGASHCSGSHPVPALTLAGDPNLSAFMKPFYQYRSTSKNTHNWILLSSVVVELYHELLYIKTGQTFLFPKLNLGQNRAMSSPKTLSAWLWSGYWVERHLSQWGATNVSCTVVFLANYFIIYCLHEFETICSRLNILGSLVLYTQKLNNHKILVMVPLFCNMCRP